MSGYLDELDAAARINSVALGDLTTHPGDAEASVPVGRAGLVGRLSERLERALTTEIISRLLVLHRVRPGMAGSKENPPSLTRRDRLRFAEAIIEADARHAHRLLDRFVARGVEARDLLVDLVGNCAADLGRQWEEDELDFGAVTMGLCALHQVVRERDWSQEPALAEQSDVGSILLTTLSGEQHTLGVMVVAEVFRNAGWRVTALPGGAPEEVKRVLAKKHFDVLGISSVYGHDVSSAAEEIAALRAASRNRDLRVMMGGQAFAGEENITKRMGVDVWVTDAESAPALAAGLRESQKTRI